MLLGGTIWKAYGSLTMFAMFKTNHIMGPKGNQILGSNK